MSTAQRPGSVLTSLKARGGRSQRPTPAVRQPRNDVEHHQWQLHDLNKQLVYEIGEHQLLQQDLDDYAMQLKQYRQDLMRDLNRSAARLEKLLDGEKKYLACALSWSHNNLPKDPRIMAKLADTVTEIGQVKAHRIYWRDELNYEDPGLGTVKRDRAAFAAAIQITNSRISDCKGKLVATQQAADRKARHLRGRQDTAWVEENDERLQKLQEAAGQMKIANLQMAIAKSGPSGKKHSSSGKQHR